jgi:hypothetical protein
MPDISMCRNEQCSQKENCYRFTAKPNDPYQWYDSFKQDENGKCDYYWPLKKPTMISFVNFKNNQHEPIKI